MFESWLEFKLCLGLRTCCKHSLNTSFLSHFLVCLLTLCSGLKSVVFPQYGSVTFLGFFFLKFLLFLLISFGYFFIVLICSSFVKIVIDPHFSDHGY